MPPRSRLSPPAALGVAVLLSAIAVGLRSLFDPLLGAQLPFITLFGAVALAVWIGGWPAAALTATLSYLGVAWLILRPQSGLEPRLLLPGAALYLLTCGIIIWLGEAMRRARQQSDAAREQLRVTLASIGDGVITTDLGPRVTYLNPVAERLTGWTRAEAQGRPLAEVFRIFNEQTGSAVENPVDRVLREGAVVGLANHTVLRTRDGGERPIDDSAAPILDSNGSILGAVLIFRDITERRRLEREAAAHLAATQRLAAIVESSDDAIIGKSLEGIIQSWNAAAERIYGYSAAEAVGRPIALIIPPDRQAEEDAFLAQLRAGERVDHIETVRRRRDGTLVNVSLSISPIRDATGRVVGASKIARDIGARRHAEQALRENEERLRLAMEAGKVGVWSWDLGTNRVSWTDSIYRIHGLTREQFDGTVEGFAALVYPEDRSRVQEAIQRTLAGELPYELEFRAIRPDGEVIWIFTNAVVIREGGRPIRMIGSTVDVTASKRAEASLREADRRKDEFLATLAHELRNPLAPIRNALAILQAGPPDPERMDWGRGVMERQVRHMTRLLDDLFDVARITRNALELRLEPITLREVIESAIETSRPGIAAAGHTLTVELPAEPVPLHADAVRLAQVFSNLLNNAVRYTPAGGEGTIRVYAARQDSSVQVTIEDNGAGIAPDALPRIFDMFSKTEASGGLGIGLALTRGLLELHGGTIEARSPGLHLGSTFRVTLPVADTAAPSGTSEAAAPSAEAAPRRRILVVDDLKDSADTLAMLLQLAGHAVDTAYDGEEALLATERFRPEVMLLDLGMPKLSGYEVCRELRQRQHRGLYIIALTGWGQEEDRRRTLESGFDHHLVKPVDPVALLDFLASLPQTAEL